MPRTGRRPGPNTSRSVLLRIAQRRFAEAGYEATSMRAIAAEAGVDPSVVVHFFGSKDGLFRAAVGWPFDPEVVAAHLAEPRREGLGASLARAFLTLYEDETTGPALLATLRSAMSHPTSATLLREFVAKQLFTHVSGRLQGADAALRVNLAASHLVGVAVLRYAFRIEPIASVTVDELVAWLEPTLARYLESGATENQPSTSGREPWGRRRGSHHASHG